MIPYRLQLAAQHVQSRITTARGMAHWDRCDPAQTLLLAGSGRSGTTWLGQIINIDNDYRDVFEPLHPACTRAMPGRPPYRYLAPADDAGEEGRQTLALLAGRVRSPWTDARNRKHIVQARLVKAIRANFLLGWLSQVCPQMKVLYALRHPCAVIHSRISLGWDTHLAELLAQPKLVSDHLDPHRELIEHAIHSGDAWQQQSVMWCLENFVPLRQLEPGSMYILFYEHFCNNFESASAQLFADLGKPMPRRIQYAREQTSAHYRRDSPIIRGGSLVAGWQSRVSTQQTDQVLAMLDAFGLVHLYDASPLPLCNPADAFIDSPPPTPLAARPTLPSRDAA